MSGIGAAELRPVSALPPPDEPDGADQRGAPRFTLLLRTARLVADDSEYLCVLRDASTTGAKVRLFAPLPPHKTLALELGNGDRHPVRLAWSRDDHAGLQFLDPIDVQRLLDERDSQHPRRPLRVRVNLTGTVQSGNDRVNVTFTDLSQHGASLSCEKYLLMNELVRLESPATPTLYAKVCWREHPLYGVVFEQTFKLDEFARMTAPLQPAALRSGGYQQR